jgi:hypothetical protein
MQDWMEAVREATFFYPAAGSDYLEPLTIFQDHIDTFWFCDVGYANGLDLCAVLPKDEFRIIQREKSGAPTAIKERRKAENGLCYWFLLPSKLIESYERTDGRRLTVVRRRGFGQIALSEEFDDCSIGVFMHRGDSPGEAGSNVYFLANKKTRYERCGRLFDKLARRLKGKALIISDGSNSSIGWLRRFHHKSNAGHEAFSRYEGRLFNYGGFLWTCVGWLSGKNGPTLVWGLTRQEPVGSTS